MAKPRTKLEHEVSKFSAQLPEISKTQKEWIHKNCLDHLGFSTIHRVICMDCGDTFSSKIVKKKSAICPSCGTKLKVANTKKRTHYQEAFTAVATTYKGYQVIRYIDTRANYAKGKKARLLTNEVIQFWINPKGKLTMIGMIHNVSWSGSYWSGDWSIRKYKGYYTTKYQLYPDAYLPGSKFLRKYTKRGINRNLQGLTFMDATAVVKFTQAETLLKAKQFALVRGMVRNPNYVINDWSSIKICLRNNYKIEDSDMWFDHIQLLRRFNKDVRNAKYVCPKNLKEEHQRYIEKQRKIDLENELAEKAEKINKEETIYKKKKARYLVLCLEKDNIKISFLNSVREIMNEGSTLHHCVWQSGYHKRDTLLFSATVDDVKIATIELDPKQLNIIQLRGKYNQATEYDDKIFDIINEQKGLIRKRKKMKLIT